MIRVRLGSKISLILMLSFVGLVVGLMIFQGVRYKRNRPLLIAAAAEADAKGQTMFDALGTPPGATPWGPGEKQAHAKSDTAPKTRIIWRQEFEVPGTSEAALAWYRQRLVAEGWKDFAYGPTSNLLIEYSKGKWLVTVSNRAEFTHPPRTRVAVQLEWYYRLRKNE